MKRTDNNEITITPQKYVELQQKYIKAVSQLDAAVFLCRKYEEEIELLRNVISDSAGHKLNYNSPSMNTELREYYAVHQSNLSASDMIRRCGGNPSIENIMQTEEVIDSSLLKINHITGCYTDEDAENDPKFQRDLEAFKKHIKDTDVDVLDGGVAIKTEPVKTEPGSLKKPDM